MHCSGSFEDVSSNTDSASHSSEEFTSWIV